MYFLYIITLVLFTFSLHHDCIISTFVSAARISDFKFQTSLAQNNFQRQSTSMNYLFAHSDDLVVPILVEWLDFADVARLDLACASSRNDRENIQRLFAAPQVVFHNNTRQLYKCFDRGNKRVLLGLVHRKIKLTKVHVMEVDSTLMETYFSICGQALMSLELDIYNNAIMPTALKYCTQLKELILYNGADIPEDSMLFSDSIETFYLNSEFGEMDESICIKFPNLRNLEVVGYGVTDDAFVGILKHVSKLQRLTLDDAQSLTETSYAAVGQHCRFLERLFVHDMSFSSEDLMNILPLTPLLSELSLRRNEEELNDKELFDGVAEYCPEITELIICNCYRKPSALGLAAFARVLSGCVHLRKLCMHSCSFVTDDYLVALSSQAKQITSLRLNECSVSDAGLAQVAKHCTELEYIHCCTGKGHLVTEACKLFFRKETTVDLYNTDARYSYIAARGGGGGGFEFVGTYDSSEEDDGSDDESDESDESNDESDVDEDVDEVTDGNSD